MSTVPNINITSNVAVYVQIKNHIMFGISAGDLKPGDQLVPVKELGNILDVNFNTVSKAYRELEILGLVYSRRGLGCFVRENSQAICREVCFTNIASTAFEITREAAHAGVSKKQLRELIDAVYASDSELYGNVPNKIMTLAKKIL